MKKTAYDQMVGQKFGKLLVLMLMDKPRPRQMLCQCECGRKKKIRATALKFGISKTCGKCSRPKPSLSHGHWGSKLYFSWATMKDRCSNSKNISFHNYGGRGITVCERWKKFENFYADMGEKPTKKHTIERIDNDGPYSPENCKWATKKEQGNNRRGLRFFEYKGEKKTLTEIARAEGINHRTLAYRLDVQKFSLEYALKNKEKLKFQHTY